MQHWALLAQHHGLKPNSRVPAELLLPAPATGFSRGQIGGVSVLRGVDLALTQDLAVPALLGDAPVRDVVPDEVKALSIAALHDPPLDLRPGNFVQRAHRTLDRRTPARTRLRCGLILFASFLL